jgi:hypothetical protein
MVLTVKSGCFPKQLCSGDIMFPARYGLDFYILFRRNPVFEGIPPP